MRRAMNKYGWSAPIIAQGTLGDLGTAPTSKGVAPAPTGEDDEENGAVSASPEPNDAEYLSPVTIGGQELNLNFDTGSADLWVFNTQLDPSDTRGHTAFDPSKSTTYKEMEGHSFMIQYGDQSAVTGTVGTDTVDIGGSTVEGQAIELATRLSDSLATDVNNDGLVGLAFSSINTVQPQPQKTFFANVMNDLDLPVFTAALKHATPGSYDFGLIDRSKYSGNISYVSVDSSQGFWQFTPDDIKIGGQSVGGGAPLIADTGTSLLLLDDSIVDAYYSQVQGASVDPAQGGYTFRCEADLPDLPIEMTKDYTAKISGQDLNYASVNGEECFGGLQSNQGEKVQILGGPLFRSQFVVFDAGNMQLGFAEHA
ncbi:MAG: hypothetical protein M1837_005455 [Sclerophora amabilis]|nr:MAG: hypothetical protein M1837_005455 [Sclerophora amabilis]